MTQCDAGEPLPCSIPIHRRPRPIRDREKVETFCKKSGSLVNVAPAAAPLMHQPTMKAKEAAQGLTPLHEALTIVLSAAQPLGLEKVAILNGLGPCAR